MTTQLRPGRHGLSRDEVRASQRGRMLLAMIDAVADAGYAATPVADVIARAGVSRATFYEHFAGKEDCFLAAFDAGVDRLLETIAAAAADAADPLPGPGDDRLAPLDAALGAYLEVLAAEPRVARVLLVEVYGAGPAALRRRAEVLQRFAGLVAAVAGDAGDPDTRFAAEAFAGAVSSMVTMRLATGDEATIPALRVPLSRLARDLLGGAAR